MVRQGFLVIGAWALVLGTITAGAADLPAEKPEPVDRQPYRIEAHVAIDDATRINAKGRAELLASWRSLTSRFVGAPWDLTIADGDGLLAEAEPQALDAAAFARYAKGRDKVWAIQIRAVGSGFELVGREYDVSFQRLAPIRRRSTPFALDLPRTLFEFGLDLFAPTATVGELSGGGVMLTVRGAALEAASPAGRIATVGSVFEPLRATPVAGGKTRFLKIPYTYLRIESLKNAEAKCAIVSGLLDPLTKRVAGKTSVVALGVKPGDRPTRLRFITRADKAPAAGYVLTARNAPDGRARELGTTGRDGRIVLEPGFAGGLVVLRLLAGSVEPMVELPLMPGEDQEERTIPFDPKPFTVALETQLDSLRDAVLDLVAIRARLEARLKARADGEDWDGVEATLKEYSNLPLRETFATKLSKLKEDAARQQAKSKSAVLTKTAQAQLADLQSLVDRYLDDEVARAFADALERARAEAVKAKRGK